MPSDTSSAAAGGTLRVGVLSAVQNLDPLHAQDFVSAMVVSQIFETPFARPMKGLDAEPMLFGERLRDESGGEGTAFSAAVRSGPCFSDGTPLTVEHVVESLRRAAPLTEQAAVEARGDRVFFRLNRPNARFDLALSQTYCAVALRRGDRLLGTGPYQTAPDATAEAMRLIRNPHHEPAAPVAELVFCCYPSDSEGRPAALLQAIERGEVEFTNVLHQQEVRALGNVRKYFELGNSTALLYLNTERPGLSDPRVRRAIGHALDRIELARISYRNPLYFAAKGLLPPMMTSWQDDVACDLGRARSLIEEAGEARPERLTLMVIFSPRPYLPHPMQVAENIANRLSSLGIEVSIERTRDSEDYYRRVMQGSYDMALSGWIADTADPADFLESLLGSHAVPSPDEPMSIHANLSRWRSPEMDRALERARREPGTAAQEEVLRLARDQMPAVPLMHGAISFVHSWRVKDFQQPPLGIPYFARLRLDED